MCVVILFLICSAITYDLVENVNVVPKEKMKNIICSTVTFINMPG